MLMTAVDNGVAALMLNRPEQGNGIDMMFAEDLLKAASAVSQGSAVRCVVLTGAGRMFCVGGDIAGFAAAGDQTEPCLKALVAPESLASEASAIAAKVADAPTGTLGDIRNLLRQGQTQGIAAQLDLEAETIGAAAAGAEAREGVSAFPARSKAGFRTISG